MLKSLQAPQRTLFDAYDEAQEEVEHLSRVERFICGYRLGVLMTLEVLQDNDPFTTIDKSASSH